MKNTRETIGTYFIDDLDTTIRTLENFRYDMLNGNYDGWGLDDNMVLIVKCWLENLRRGTYSN